MTTSPLPLGKLVTLIDDDTYATWREVQQFAVTIAVEIDLEGVLELNDVFVRAKNGLRLPDAVGLRTWSGLEDHLWSAVAQHTGAEATVTIRHVDELLSQQLEDLLELVSILTAVATQASSSTDLQPARTVQIVLTGTDLNFPLNRSTA